MSVYTPVSEAELASWLRNYSVGQLAECEPIESGIENTNYFVTTSQGRYVLTLFERLPAEELPFYLDLMAHLARHGIPCPAPIADLSDQYLGSLNGKPAALVTRLPGRSLEKPGAPECEELGALLGRMHLAGRSYSAYLENPRGPKWWRFAAREVTGFLKEPQRELLEKELAFQSEQRFPDLPRGPVHADLFRDNALFDGARLSGVVDFYFAGVDCLLYDLAVCANDWCLESKITACMPGRTGPARCLSRGAAVHGARARGVAGNAARRGAALLAVAALRLPPAAARDAGARARPGAFPPYPALARRRPGPLDGLMQARIVETAGGARWLAEGWRLFRAAPLQWIALTFTYMLIMVLMSVVPLIGTAGFLVIYPALTVGLMAAARAASRRTALEVGMLFDGFRQGLRVQLVLGAIYLACSIVVFAAIALADDEQKLRTLLVAGGAEEIELSDLAAPLGALAAALYADADDVLVRAAARGLARRRRRQGALLQPGRVRDELARVPALWPGHHGCDRGDRGRIAPDPRAYAG